MKADTQTRRTPRRKSSSTSAASVSGSLGEWIKLHPQGTSAPSSRPISSNAPSTFASVSPPAPKNPIAPARPASITSRVEAMPRAISPTT